MIKIEYICIIVLTKCWKIGLDIVIGQGDKDRFKYGTCMSVTPLLFPEGCMDFFMRILSVLRVSPIFK